MRLLRAIWFRLRALLRPDAVNAEFDEELRFHIDRETAENVKRGMSPAEARRVALAHFGGVELYKEELRDQRELRWFDDITADMRHGARLLRKNMLFSGAVIGTLALGIGATSTIFAIVNGVLLRPLPYVNPNAIVSVSGVEKGVDRNNIVYSDFLAFRESSKTLSAISVYSSTSAVFTEGGEPIDVQGAQTSASFFDVLAVQPLLGRLYTVADESPTAARVVVLSYAMWMNRFGGDSTIINRSVMMNGVPRTVLGVLPASVDLPHNSRFWSPLRIPKMEGGNEYFFASIGRLRNPLASVAASKELQGILARIDSTRHIKDLNGRKMALVPLHDRLFGSARKPLALLLSAVVVLLLIACANVANLTLARSAARRREFAVRLALGASRWRVVRQLLVESSLLAMIGGAIGALIPLGLVGVFVRLSPKSVAGVEDIHVNGTVLLFTAAVTVVVALLFGLAPAMTGSRSGASGALASGSTRLSSSRAHNALRSTLVVFEVAAALTLLTGAGLLTKSFAKALALNPGYRADRVFAAYVQLPNARYSTTASVQAFYSQMAERVRAIPGVDQVSVSGARPLYGYSFSKLLKHPDPNAAKVRVAFSEVDGNYASVLGLELLSGRFINETDVPGAPMAVVLNESAARALFPGKVAVGQYLNKDEVFGDSTALPLVVGIVRDVAQKTVEEGAEPLLFQAGAQRDMTPNFVIVRTSLSENALRSAIKNIISGIDPLQPLTQFVSLRDELSKSFAPRRFNSLLINAFAALALLLAMIGLYGLMAQAVIARTRELGIRIALGAQTRSVLRLVMRQGFALVAAGVIAGLLLSYAMSRTVSSLLYDVPAQDPIIFIGAPLTLVVVALLACYIPARNATRVSPMNALRQD